MEVYFDNAASTMVREEAAAATIRVMCGKYGNPSSVHNMGRSAAGELASARRRIAVALGAKPENIYFTSGGTEADNWAVFGIAEPYGRKGKHILTSAIEHDAVIEPVRKLERLGWEATYIKPDSAGRIPPESFAAALREDTVLASVMLVNNETGAVNPVGEYAREIRRRGLGTILHTDAVQGFCKIPFTVKSLGADLATISAHKLHGPKGVGALYVRDGVKLSPLLLGGGQENKERPGTEALPAAAGFGEAVRLGHTELEETAAAVRKIRDFTTMRLAELIPEAVVIGGGDSPFILSLSLPGFKSEVLMSFLDGEGICVSKSAACKKGARSRVLEAMSLKNTVIDGALRVSFSRYSSQEEAMHFVQTLKRATQTLLKSL